MRHPLILIAALLCAASAADAQVTVDLHALDRLPSADQAPAPAPRPRAERRPIATAPRTTAPVKGPATAALPPAPAVSEAAPPPVGSPPPPTPAPAAPVAAPATAPPPPPPPAVATKQPAAASIRILFARDQSELNPAGIDAVKGLIKTASAGDAAGFTVSAYADGVADDPSSGRRLSLARARAARAALIDNGIPSSQITVRALGGRVGEGPPDRVDIVAGNATGTP